MGVILLLKANVDDIMSGIDFNADQRKSSKDKLITRTTASGSCCYCPEKSSLTKAEFIK